MFLCHQVVYCEKACQKLHWFTHKKVCKKLQEQREKQEAEAEHLRMQQSKGTFAQCRFPPSSMMMDSAGSHMPASTEGFTSFGPHHGTFVCFRGG